MSRARLGVHKLKDGELREMVAALDVDQSLDGMVFRSLVGEPHGATKNGGIKIWMKNMDIYSLWQGKGWKGVIFSRLGLGKHDKVTKYVFRLGNHTSVNTRWLQIRFGTWYRLPRFLSQDV